MYAPVSGNRKGYSTFVSQWNVRMNSAFDLANQNIDKSSNYNKNKLDQNARCEKIVKYEIGKIGFLLKWWYANQNGRKR